MRAPRHGKGLGGMRIAIVHSFYSSRQPSGENRVVVDQADALADAGYEVTVVARHTDREEVNRLYPLRAAWTVATGWGPEPSEELQRWRPDVVHVHNLFPNFGARWLDRWTGPVIMTAHNYRTLCANGLLFRGNGLCTECPTVGVRSGVRHACYRDSRLASLPAAAGIVTSGRRILRRADRIVTLSVGADVLLRRLAPFPLSTSVVPNFVRSMERPPADYPTGWVAVGRLSPEKGMAELIREWPANRSLTVIGGGPQSRQLEDLARGRRVTIIPALDHPELLARLPGFIGLVLPSRWPEVAPVVVSEAMSRGVPVVAHQATVVTRVIEESRSGAVYSDAPSLASALDHVEKARPEMSANAHAYAERMWRKDAWLIGIGSVYDEVVKRERPR